MRTVKSFSQKGFTIAELMVAVAIGGIVSMVLATFFTFAAEQFYSLIDQNEAEQSILLTSYYLRSALSQAVKTMAVAGDPTGNFASGTANTLDGTVPNNVGTGFFDISRTCTESLCINSSMSSPWPVGWPGGTVTPLAYFVKESGLGTGSPPTSQYVDTGIFFIPPQGTQAGRLYISQFLASGGGSFTPIDSSLSSQFYFDRIVGFGLATTTSFATGASGAVPGLPYPALASVTLYVRARYFKGVSSIKDYSSDPNTAAAAGSNFTDISSTINVTLRDNILGLSLTGTGQYERPDNGLYFYQFTTPTLENF